MIKAKLLKRVVDSKVLFNNIDLELPSNQITGLLGANGAGKTSLFRAIAGLSSIDSGELTFFDKDLIIEISCADAITPARFAFIAKFAKSFI